MTEAWIERVRTLVAEERPRVTMVTGSPSEQLPLVLADWTRPWGGRVILVDPGDASAAQQAAQTVPGRIEVHLLSSVRVLPAVPRADLVFLHDCGDLDLLLTEIETCGAHARQAGGAMPPILVVGTDPEGRLCTAWEEVRRRLAALAPGLALAVSPQAPGLETIASAEWVAGRFPEASALPVGPGRERAPSTSLFNRPPFQTGRQAGHGGREAGTAPTGYPAALASQEVSSGQHSLEQAIRSSAALEAAERRLSEVEREANSWRSKWEENLVDLIRQKSAAASLGAKAAAQEERLAERMEALRRAEEQAADQSQRETKLRGEFDRVRDQLREARAQAQRHEELLAHAREELRGYRQEAEGARQALPEKIREAEAAQARVASLERELGQTSGSLERLRSKNEELLELRDALRASLLELRTDLDKHESGHAAAQRELALRSKALDDTRQEIKKLADERDTLRAQLMEAKAEVVRRGEALQTVRENLKQAQGENERSQTELRSVREESAGRAEALSKIKAEHDQVKTESEARGERIAELREGLSLRTKQLEEVRIALEKSKSEVVARGEKIGELKEAVERRAQDTAEIREALRSSKAEVVARGEKIAELKESLAAQALQHKDTQAALDQARADSEVQAAKAGDLETKLAYQARQYEEIKTSLQQAEADSAKRQQKIEELEQHLSVKMKAFEETRAALDAARSEVVARGEKLAELKETLGTRSREVAESKEALRKANEEVVARGEKLAELKETLGTRSREVEESKEALRKADEEVVARGEKIVELEKALSERARAAEETRTALQAARQEAAGHYEKARLLQSALTQLEQRRKEEVETLRGKLGEAEAALDKVEQEAARHVERLRAEFEPRERALQRQLQQTHADARIRQRTLSESLEDLRAQYAADRAEAKEEIEARGRAIQAGRRSLEEYRQSAKKEIEARGQALQAARRSLEQARLTAKHEIEQRGHALGEAKETIRQAERTRSELLLWQRNQAIHLLLDQRRRHAQHVRQMIRLVEALYSEARALRKTYRWRTGNVVARTIEIATLQGNRSASSKRLEESEAAYCAWKDKYVAEEASAVSSDVTEKHNAFATPKEFRANLRYKDAVVEKVKAELQHRSEALGTLMQRYDEVKKLTANLRRSFRWRVGNLVMGGLETFTLARRKAAPAAGIDALASQFSTWCKVYEAAAGEPPVLLPLPEGAERPIEYVPAAAPTPQGGLAAVGELPKPQAAPLPSARREAAALPAPVPPQSVTPPKPSNGSRPALSDKATGDAYVVQFTADKARNPFYVAVPQELRRQGWDFGFSTDPEAVAKRVQKDAGRTGIVHFHQLEPLYRRPLDDDREEVARNAEKLYDFMRRIKDDGGRIVWTAHNPKPHDSKFEDIDRQMMERTVELADRICVLGKGAKRYMAQYAGASKIEVIPHPFLGGYYGAPVPRDEARKQLGIDPGRFVFGNLGEVRPYKGLEHIIDAMQSVGARSNGSRPILLIGGKAGPRDYIERIKASSSEYIIVRAEEIPNDEIPVWLGAMDAAVFAFNSIWVSTSVILAMSYGVPPVVPDMGCLDEYVYDEDTGLVYTPQDPEALAQRILDMQQSPLLGHMRYMCGVMAEKNSVANIAGEYGTLYRAAMAG